MEFGLKPENTSLVSKENVGVSMTTVFDQLTGIFHRVEAGMCPEHEERAKALGKKALQEIVQALGFDPSKECLGNDGSQEKSMEKLFQYIHHTYDHGKYHYTLVSKKTGREIEKLYQEIYLEVFK